MSDFKYPKPELSCLIGGVSPLDLPKLNLADGKEVQQFLTTYGYSLESETDRQTVTHLYRRAVALIREELLEPTEKFFDMFTDPENFGGVQRLPLIASWQNDSTEQKWACAILRVMHVFVHLRNDLFSAFRDDIQNQILTPFQDVISKDDNIGPTVLGLTTHQDRIPLHRFEIKPFKTTSSSAIKLLAHQSRFAMTLLDKLGVRFVTKGILDSFRVTRYLIDQHLVSFPHVMTNESNNTIYPLKQFFELIETLGEQWVTDHDKIETELKKRLATLGKKAEFLDKANEFSDPDFGFIKFITRKLITVNIQQAGGIQAFSFFYPFEVQIMAEETWLRNMNGPMAHDAYKDRQRRRARLRVFGRDGIPHD